MDYNELTEDEYRRLVGDLVKLTESLHAGAQDVGDGRATIGYDYTFNRATTSKYGGTLASRSRKPNGLRCKVLIARPTTQSARDSAWPFPVS